MSPAAGEETCIMLREKALPRGKETAQEGETELTAVSVAGKHQVKALPAVQIKIVRSVGQQDGKGIGCQPGQSFGKGRIAGEGRILYPCQDDAVAVSLQDPGLIP